MSSGRSVGPPDGLTHLCQLWSPVFEFCPNRGRIETLKSVLFGWQFVRSSPLRVVRVCPQGLQLEIHRELIRGLGGLGLRMTWIPGLMGLRSQALGVADFRSHGISHGGMLKEGRDFLFRTGFGRKLEKRKGSMIEV